MYYGVYPSDFMRNTSKKTDKTSINLAARDVKMSCLERVFFDEIIFVELEIRIDFPAKSHYDMVAVKLLSVFCGGNTTKLGAYPINGR